MPMVEELEEKHLEIPNTKNLRLLWGAEACVEGQVLSFKWPL